MGDKSPVDEPRSGPSSPKEGRATASSPEALPASASSPQTDTPQAASRKENPAMASSPKEEPATPSPREAIAAAASPQADTPRAASPEESSPTPATPAGILPAQHWIQAAEDEGVVPDDGASIAESLATSTQSLTSSILKYRNIHGRTYHSDVGNAEYWIPNDGQQNDSMDIIHHVHTLLLNGKLFSAPLDTEKIQKVLDIGTGTGNWAIDFADDHPDVEVIGTDISPIQPGWAPPNLKFEIEDCTREWTFEPESVDYVHIRLLIGAISDWYALFEEAYKTLKPGGWIESYEGRIVVESDDGTVTEMSAMDQWGRIFIHFGETIGRSFTVVEDKIQRKAMEAAGFVNIQEQELPTPLGNWPRDPRMKEIGTFSQLAGEADIEGYLLYPATTLGWTPQEVTVFAAHYRRELRDTRIHSYYRHNVVWARKPL